MPEQMIKTIFEQAWNYLWFVFLALWGGTASYISRLKKTGAGLSLVELIGEWTISGFAGMMTAYVCQSMSLNYFATAGLVGVAGHMGGRAIFIAENMIEARARKITGSHNNE